MTLGQKCHGSDMKGDHTFDPTLGHVAALKLVLDVENSDGTTKGL